MSDINFNQVTNFKINNQEVSGIKIDGKDAWSGGGEKSKILHFTLRNGSNNATVTVERGSMIVLPGTDSSTYFWSSYDGKTWTEFPQEMEVSFNLSSNGNKTIYIKGNNPSGWEQSIGSYQVHISTSGDPIDAGGSIMSLLDEVGEQTNIPQQSLFYTFFQNCSNLVTAPELPATELSIGCYGYMFLYCTSLTQAPELPATTLTDGCYNNMFEGCTSLTTAPELPATTLGSNCYSSMFNCCASLTQAPELPATTLTDSCYSSMFYGCASLTRAPKLPSTTLSGNCYYQMFQGCISLNTLPELPATTLTGLCYYYMFYNCKSIKMSTTSHDEYTNQYVFGAIPSMTSSASWGMFASTGGDYNSFDEVNYKTLYTSNEIIYAND